MHDFNTDAAEWVELWSGLAAPAREAVADRLRAGDRVLDIGCGSGEFCALAHARAMTASGIDIAPAMIEIARTRAPAADLRVGSMDALPWADGEFDAVVGFNSLQFADDPVVALREWARVSRRDVVVVLWGPHERCELHMITTALRGLAGEPEPPPRLGTRIESVVHEAGLQLVDAHDVQIPFVADQERFEAALLWDGWEFGLDDDVALAAIRDAAAPFRQDDGVYRLDNVFRVMRAAV
jgi:SAM-dependent methyltransferase